MKTTSSGVQKMEFLYELSNKLNWQPFFRHDIAIAQSFSALAAFNHVLLNEMPGNIIEIGTASGMFTLFLGIYASGNNAKVFTYDIANPSSLFLELSQHLPIKFTKRDVFADESITEISEIIKSGKILLLCDGGNKPKEFKTFFPMLKKGDLIAVHDWGSEFTKEFMTGFESHLDYIELTECHWVFFRK